MCVDTLQHDSYLLVLGAAHDVVSVLKRKIGYTDYLVDVRTALYITGTWCSHLTRQAFIDGSHPFEYLALVSRPQPVLGENSPSNLIGSDFTNLIAQTKNTVGILRY